MRKQHPARSSISITLSFRLIGVVAVVLVLGLLLWSKLILVTGFPRTAVADPDKNSAPVKHVAPR
jgi:hypothetical protein